MDATSLSQRAKGAAAEREARGVLIDLLGPCVSKRRLEQTRDGGHDLDVAGLVALEVKRQEKASLLAWMKQAITQSPHDRLPAVMWRPNRSPWLVCMTVDDWAVLVREAIGEKQ